jgi:hypothetical protein
MDGGGEPVKVTHFMSATDCTKLPSRHTGPGLFTGVVYGVLGISMYLPKAWALKSLKSHPSLFSVQHCLSPLQ